VRGTSGLRAIRHFCPTCGSLLFGTPEVSADAVTVYVGTLDEPSLFQPRAVMFKRDRHDWDIIAGRFTEFETMPPIATGGNGLYLEITSTWPLGAGARPLGND